MKTKLIHLTCFLTALLALATVARAQSTAFTYQGRLNDGTVPANGTYNLRFALFDALTVGNQVGSPVTNSPVNVSNGLFTVTLDFGANFPGAGRWLEIGVRTNGGGAFTSLIPRQPITATPYAITAGNLNGALSGTSLSGTYSSPVTLNNVANNFAGSGSNLTALNASQLTIGTVPAAALGNAWRIDGNAGTTPGTQFLGTTDNQALELKVNGVRGFRLQPGTFSPNVVGGGFSSIAAGLNAVTIGGGQENTVSSSTSTIGGGLRNSIGSGGQDATIGGGQINSISNNTAAATVAGGTRNSIGSGSDNAALGGGDFNRILSDSPIGTIAGGQFNLISSNAPYATIGGGTNNSIGQYSEYATIAGGGLNSMPFFARGATISGGTDNHIDSDTYESVIGGGFLNHIYDNADNSVIGGGYANEVRGARGVIPGGSYNKANGANSFAAGYTARALHAGCFVWSDPTGDFLFPPGVSSTGDNQFVIRATGGVQLDPATSLFCGSRTRQMLNLWGTQYGLGVQGYTMYSRADVGAGFAWYQGGTHSDAAGDSGGGQTLMSLDSSGATLPGSIKFGTSSLRQMLDLWAGQHGIGVQGWTTYFRTIGGGANGGFAWYKGGVHADSQFDAGGGTELMRLAAGGLWVNTTFVNSSDRNVKQDFAAVNSRAVLEKVAQLPIQTWAYKNDPHTKHLGPVAQDFYAAFAVGPDDKHITTVDESGVALAAIQGLNQKVEEQRVENAELKARLEKLERLMSQKNGGAK